MGSCWGGIKNLTLTEDTLLMGLDTSVKDGGRPEIEALRSFLEASTGFADTEARARSLVSPGPSESAGPGTPGTKQLEAHYCRAEGTVRENRSVNMKCSGARRPRGLPGRNRGGSR